MLHENWLPTYFEFYFFSPAVDLLKLMLLICVLLVYYHETSLTGTTEKIQRDLLVSDWWINEKDQEITLGP